MELSEKDILLHVKVADRDELLRLISKRAEELGNTDSAENLFKAFIEREKDYSTGLQEGFAIPHAKTNFVKSVGIIYARLDNPIDWETYDDQPVTDVFALMVPEANAGTTHLQMLSNLATELLEDEFKQHLRELDNQKDISEYISKKMGVDVLWVS